MRTFHIGVHFSVDYARDNSYSVLSADQHRRKSTGCVLGCDVGSTAERQMVQKRGIAGGSVQGFSEATGNASLALGGLVTSSVLHMPVSLYF